MKRVLALVLLAAGAVPAETPLDAEQLRMLAAGKAAFVFSLRAAAESDGPADLFEGRRIVLMSAKRPPEFVEKLGEVLSAEGAWSREAPAEEAAAYAYGCAVSGPDGEVRLLFSGDGSRVRATAAGKPRVGALVKERAAAVREMFERSLPDKADEAARRRLDEYLCARLEEAERVETFLVDEEGQGDGAKGVVQKRSITEAGEVFDAGYARELRTLLFDPDHDEAGPDMCGHAGIGMRLSGPEGRVDAVLCFRCDRLSISGMDVKNNLLITFFVRMGGGRAGLVRLVKRAFPKDEEIGALKDEFK